ncbi:uncharacterized protein K02A2.6-like isoform X4 [Neocloeon triangulifer]|uniref:uncharacterized protein K02A2.6-like isoform X4 n=2 Tax=Neocloeon triangulifer TaxID=2078957 RepID=UPI00286EF3BB|nr:uncharacterized protein K02A2.6-like isoform X4 [Neocloeon triangulifer]XP_059478356.1 uncharacterized protein K02A2.6-like isoform X4 [Neocloeon triangulifer]XP_059486780.1 uncharacterized protein K02A2.6-like isoform X4 [Neocloeon triangulifer]XP_059489155.1 uncharacterized protein K02A2.6-like isoform X4 [Neocloeon triangulifer]
MSDKAKVIGSFDPKGVLSFSQYLSRWKFHFAVKKVTEDADKKNMFVDHQSEEAFEVFCKVSDPEGIEAITFAKLTERLAVYYRQTEPQTIVYKNEFNQRVQGPDESAAVYLAELTSLAKKCKFSKTDELLVPKIISGLRDLRLKQTLLAEEDAKLTLDFVKTKVLAHERAELTAKALGLSSSQGTVNKIGQEKKSQWKKGQGQQGSDQKQHGQVTCFACGKDGHKFFKCKVRDKLTCKKCKKKGHVEQVCRSSTQKAAHHLEDQEEGEDEASGSDGQEQLQAVTNYLLRVESTSKPPVSADQKLMLEILLNGKPLMLEVDTGATFSLIGLSTYDKYFPDRKALLPSNVRMKAWGQQGEIRAAGKVQVKVTPKGGKPVNLELLVMEQSGPSLLGRNWFKQLGIAVELPIILKTVDLKKEPPDPERLPEIFKMTQVPPEFEDLKEVFEPVLGKWKGEPVHIPLKKGATPVRHSARRVPFGLQEKASAAIDELERRKVIEKVMFSEWATPVVYVEKGEGVRLCADYSATVNPLCSAADFPLPTIDKLLAEVKPGCFFTKIDLADAYLQFPVDEASSEVLAIATHKGTYRFLRLPPGLSVCPPIFQKKISGLVCKISGVIVYFDDLLIFAFTRAQLIQKTRAVLKIFIENGLKVKLTKCSFCVPELEYLGYSFTQEGIQPKKDKLEALEKMPPPQSIEDLRALLGYFNYYDRFVPNKAQILFPVYRLLKKGVPFDWTPECQQSMDKMTKLLVNSFSLAYFDPKKRIRLACDASRKGLGAVLSQLEDRMVEVPVMFVSRALKKSELNYSQVELEALAIVWAVKKLKNYLWGQQFEILTDHKPLLGIFGKGKLMSDDLSSKLKRLPLPVLEDEEEEEEARVAFLQAIELPQSHISLQELREFTEKDEQLRRIQQKILQGTHPDNLTSEDGEFGKRWRDLKSTNGVITFVGRAVIPRDLRSKVLGLLHLNHFGQTRMKTLARTYFWWPNMDEEIEQVTLSCMPCAITNRAPSKAPIIPWSVPHRPWSRVHLDFFEVVHGKSYIVAADGLSNWIDAERTNNLETETAIKYCRKLFRVQGLCDILVCDNGPAFRAEKFKKFCEMNGIELIYSPPYSPQTNGLAEKTVQTVKYFLKKVPEKEWELRLDSFLLGHNSTPSSALGGVSPAEFNLGRRPHTLLDKTRPASAVVNQKAARDKKVAAAVAEKPLKLVPDDQPVVLRSYRNPKVKWEAGAVVTQLGPRRVLVETEAGLTERHTDQIKKIIRPAETPPEPPQVVQEVPRVRPDVAPDPVLDSEQKDGPNQGPLGSGLAKSEPPDKSPMSVPSPTRVQPTPPRRSQRAAGLPAKFKDFIVTKK